MAKKIKKVETPIDQHETFVSLQKNFADSEISVEEKLKTLYELQKADSDIDKIMQLRGELPAEVETLEAEVAQMKAKQAQLTAMIDEYNKSIAVNKQNAVDCDDQIAKYRSQLENIANSREYDSIDKEVENQELLRQIAEKNISDIKVKIAERKSDIEVLKDALTLRSEDLKAKKQELAGIVDATAPQEEKLRAVREACAARYRGCHGSPGGETPRRPRGLRRQDRRPYHECVRAHPPQCPQPPGCGVGVQWRFLRRLLQYDYAPASRGDRFQQEAHHLRTLRTHHCESGFRIEK